MEMQNIKCEVQNMKYHYAYAVELQLSELFGTGPDSDMQKFG